MFFLPCVFFFQAEDGIRDRSPSRGLGDVYKRQFVKVFRIVSKDGDTQHWATDVMDMDESKREDLTKKSWKIEEYHRGIKQFCGVEKCQARKEESQRAHIMFSLRAFLRLELQRIK